MIEYPVTIHEAVVEDNENSFMICGKATLNIVVFITISITAKLQKLSTNLSLSTDASARGAEIVEAEFVVIGKVYLLLAIVRKLSNNKNLTHSYSVYKKKKRKAHPGRDALL
jgi:hypothetical protein